MEKNELFESVAVEAAIEAVYEDICCIENILFEYSGSGKLKETITDKKALKKAFSDHIDSIKENTVTIQNGELQDDAIEGSNKRLVYLAGKCYDNNQFYHALHNQGEADEELDDLWKRFLSAMYDFNKAVESDPRIYNMSKALELYKEWTGKK